LQPYSNQVEKPVIIQLHRHTKQTSDIKKLEQTLFAKLQPNLSSQRNRKLNLMQKESSLTKQSIATPQTAVKKSTITATSPSSRKKPHRAGSGVEMH
jgi:hypothetical protein